MRWIFFSLLAANLALLGWRLMAPPAELPSASPQVTPASSDTTLYLLNEIEERGPGGQQRSAGAAASDESRALSPELERSPTESEQMCTFVGPFDERSAADQLVERLRAMEVPAQVEELEIPAGPGYWVYIAPLPSRREALRYLGELQGRGVDSYIIPRGDLMNGISLGMFSREALAQARLQEMAELEIDARLEVIERSYKELWVSVPASAGRLGDEAWQRLMGDDSSLERRQNFCLHVASQDNIH